MRSVGALERGNGRTMGGGQGERRGRRWLGDGEAGWAMEWNLKGTRMRSAGARERGNGGTTGGG